MLTLADHTGHAHTNTVSVSENVNQPTRATTAQVKLYCETWDDGMMNK